MTKRLRLLIVEDCEDDAQLLLRQIRREGFDVVALRVDTADAMRDALENQSWDVILSDYAMPAFSAIEARGVLSETGADIPFIIISGTIGEETAVKALKSGANDFLTKGRLSRLVPAIEREMRDADERRRLHLAEGALVETRERMRFALDAAGVGTWEWDVVGDRVVWSDLLERLHGIPEGGFGGTFGAFIASMHPEDQQRVRDTRRGFLKTRGDTHLEYRVLMPDKTVRWIASIGRAFYDSEQRPIRAAGIGFDITHEKQLQEHLAHAQKMESVGNLAGGIAHDFNNLLTVVEGCCQLLQENPAIERQETAMRDVREIRRAVDRGAALTRQLLAFSRKQLLAPQIVSVNDIVTNLVSMLHRLIEESVHLDFRLATDLARVNVDPGQLEQVLVNLVVNARDAMPEGGRLTIETANVTIDAKYAHEHVEIRPGRHVMLSVSDTGLGIPRHLQAHVFEPFFTTKPKGQGTGLGLATVYGIVSQSGGYIFLYSEPEIGTTFKIYFPTALDETAAAPVHTRADQPQALEGNETILVVEDDVRLRDLDERILKKRGYHVLVAASAQEAIQTCTAYEEPIHLVLTDVIMPGGSGRVIGDWVVEHRPETRVVYMSGYTDNAIARHGVLEAGIRFLPKPFSPEALLRAIRAALV
jgi:signal transduction histidine kinase/DNA-binding response OmpR family regulator